MKPTSRRMKANGPRRIQAVLPAGPFLDSTPEMQGNWQESPDHNFRTIIEGLSGLVYKAGNWVIG